MKKSKSELLVLKHRIAYLEQSIKSLKAVARGYERQVERLQDELKNSQRGLRKSDAYGRRMAEKVVLD